MRFEFILFKFWKNQRTEAAVRRCATEALAVKLEATHKPSKPLTIQPNHPQITYKPSKPPTNHQQITQIAHKPAKYSTAKNCTFLSVKTFFYN